MACTGYGDCKRGTAPCRSPLTCSGMDVDQAIEHFRLHRRPMPVPATPWPSTEGTLSEPIRRVNVIAAAVIGSAVLAGLAWAAYAAFLS